MGATEELEKNGFTIFEFAQLTALTGIQHLIQGSLPCSLEDYHLKPTDHSTHLKLVKTVTDKLIESHLVWQLVFDNRLALTALLGPDIDTQMKPHLRISRPDQEGDLVSWHRDTFYGNTPWEINLWFPIFDLKPGAGLMLVPGSHVIPMKNVRDVEEADIFKKLVTKGSLANQVGYTYAAKTDDLISNLTENQIQLLRPEVGSAVLFFGCMAHRATNTSKCTRITVDTRVRNIFTPTETRPGYYEELCRGPVSTSVGQFLKVKP